MGSALNGKGGLLIVPFSKSANNFQKVIRPSFLKTLTNNQKELSHLRKGQQSTKRLLLKYLKQSQTAQEEFNQKINNLQENNQRLMDNIEKLGIQSQSDPQFFTNQELLELVDQKKCLNSQEKLHAEVFKEIDGQEDGCIQLYSGQDSVENQLGSKESYLSLNFQSLFGITSNTCIQLVIHRLQGSLLVSISLTLIFGSLYIIKSYYIKLYYLSPQSNRRLREQILLILAYFSCLSFSFALPVAWFLCWSYTTFTPRKLNFFETFLSLKETNIKSQPLLSKGPLFIFLKSGERLVLPVKAVVAFVYLDCARKKAGYVFKDPAFFTCLVFTTFFYSFTRLLVDAYLTEKVKQNIDSINEEKTIKLVNSGKKGNTLTNISIPNIKEVFFLSISLSSGFYALQALALIFQDIVSAQNKNKKS